MSLTQMLQVPFAPQRYGQPGGTLLPDLVNSTAQSSLGLIEDDDFVVALFPRTLPSTIGGNTTTLQLSTGSSIVFSIKSVLGMSGSTLLGEAVSFTESQDLNGNWYYSAVLNLQDSALATAMGTSPSLTCVGEIRITDATGATMRYQFTVIFYQAVYTGAESPVTAPTPGQVLFFTNGSQAIPSGSDYYQVTGLGLASTPAMYYPQLLKADGTRANINCYLRSGWTTDGFIVDFDAIIPDNTYTLTWVIVPTSGSVGSVAIAAGVDLVAVPLTLPKAPTLIVPILVKASGGEGNIRAFLRSGWTGAGFTVDLSGLTPDSTYVLYYLLIP